MGLQSYLQRRRMTRYRLKTLLRPRDPAELTFLTTVELTQEQRMGLHRWWAAGFTAQQFVAALEAFRRAGVSGVPLPPSKGVAGRIWAALKALKSVL